MKEEYDFSEAERGRFYHPDAVLRFPVYLDPEVDDYLSELAEQEDVDVQALVNEWLRANIRLVKSVRKT